MSPLPSFPPEWFTAKLPPGTPAPRQLPPSAFQPPPVPPGLMAQIPVLATVPPAVAAMVVEALRAPPLTTATMPAPPASVLQAGPLPYLPSTPMAPPYCGGHPGDSWSEVKYARSLSYLRVSSCQGYRNKVAEDCLGYPVGSIHNSFDNSSCGALHKATSSL